MAAIPPHSPGSSPRHEGTTIGTPAGTRPPPAAQVLAHPGWDVFDLADEPSPRSARGLRPAAAPRPPSFRGAISPTGETIAIPEDIAARYEWQSALDPARVVEVPAFERLRARTADNVSPLFSCIDEALAADGLLGADQPQVASAALTFVLEHVSLADIEAVCAKAREAKAHRILTALEGLDPAQRWTAQVQPGGPFYSAVVCSRGVTIVPADADGDEIYIPLPGARSVAAFTDTELVIATENALHFYFWFANEWSEYNRVSLSRDEATFDGVVAVNENRMASISGDGRGLTVWRREDGAWNPAPLFTTETPISHVSVLDDSRIILTLTDHTNLLLRQEGAAWVRDADAASETLEPQRIRLPRLAVERSRSRFNLLDTTVQAAFWDRQQAARPTLETSATDKLRTALTLHHQDEAFTLALSGAGAHHTIEEARRLNYWNVIAAVIDSDHGRILSLDALTPEERLAVLAEAVELGLTNTAMRLWVSDWSSRESWASPLAEHPLAQGLAGRAFAKGLPTLGASLLARGAPLFSTHAPIVITSFVELENLSHAVASLVDAGFAVEPYILAAPQEVLAQTLPLAMRLGNDEWTRRAAQAVDVDDPTSAGSLDLLVRTLVRDDVDAQNRARMALQANTKVWSRIPLPGYLSDEVLDELRALGFSPVELARSRTVETGVPGRLDPVELAKKPLKDRLAALHSYAVGSHTFRTIAINGNTDELPDELLDARYRVWFAAFHVTKGDGIDHGGLTRDWLFTTTQRFFDPATGLFVPTASDASRGMFSNATYTADDHSQIRFFGRLVAKNILIGAAPGIRLAPYLYKVLLGQRVGIEDLALVDAALADNLQKMKAMDADTIAALGLTFEDETRELTAANLDEYIEETIDRVLVRNTQRPIEEFATGLFDLIPVGLLRLFSPEELQRLIEGERELDIEDWKRHTRNNETHGVARAPEAIELFWDVVSNVLTEAERHELLRTVTGATHTPIGGFARLEPAFGLQVMRRVDLFPVAHTCSHVLEIPPDQTRDSLAHRLRALIANGRGFTIG